MKRDEWRILVGTDAERLDTAVRTNPNAAYEPDFEGIVVEEVK